MLRNADPPVTVLGLHRLPHRRRRGHRVIFNLPGMGMAISRASSPATRARAGRRAVH